MPGFDGTGPRGMGPMTGGGRGFCGQRGARAFQRGGMAWAYPSYGGPPPLASYARRPAMTVEQEAELLKNQAQVMSEELENIQKRLRELEAK